MRIIFLNRFFYPDLSATSQLLSDLAFFLASEGRKVVVITSRLQYEDDTPSLPAHETTNGVQVHRIWSTRFGRRRLLGRALDLLTFHLAAAWKLWRLARAGDVIVAKTDPPLLSVPAAAIARWRKARLVNWLQDVFPEVAEASSMGGAALRPVFTMLRALRNWSLKQAAANVAIGERMAQHLRREGVAPARIRIIANWHDGAAVRPLPHEENPLRQRWRLQEKFAVAYAGNLGRVHEYETILQAMRRLHAHDDIVFVFIGGGSGLAQLRRKVADAGLQNAQFHPYQPRELLNAALNAADVHLISLRPAFEGLVVPSKFYGVAAAGRPAIFIGDADGEVARLLREHACGLTVAPGEGAQLAEAILRLKDDADMRRDMGRHARQLLERHFDRPIALRRWAELLKMLD